MHESEQPSALIGGIYDAALDPTLWVDCGLLNRHTSLGSCKYAAS